MTQPKRVKSRKALDKLLADLDNCQTPLTVKRDRITCRNGGIAWREVTSTFDRPVLATVVSDCHDYGRVYDCRGCSVDTALGYIT